MVVEGEQPYRYRAAHHNVLDTIIAGSLAGASAATLTAPLDLAKTRLQVQRVPKYEGIEFRRYAGLFGTLRRTFADEGARGWFKGLGSMLAGLVPSWAIYFSTYNYLKERVSAADIFVHPTPTHIVSAMCAGAITSTITNPIWVIKTRLQTQVHSENPKYEGILHAFNKILKQEGVRGLFRGLPVSLIGCIHVMIQFPLYESLKTRFHKGNDSKLSVYEILVSSVLAKVAATSITYPHEVLRSRFQKFSRPGVSLNITNVVKDMILKEGYHVFYQGFGITLFRVIPTSGITFAVYEYSLAAFDRWRHL